VLDVRVGVCEPVLDALELNETDLVENGLAVEDTDPVTVIVGVRVVVIVSVPVYDMIPDFVSIIEIVFVDESLLIAETEADGVTETVLVLIKDPLVEAESVTVFVTKFDADDVVEPVDVLDCERLFV